MFRMGAELVAEKEASFSYALLSLWRIKPQNNAKTEAEKSGLDYVAEHPGSSLSFIAMHKLSSAVVFLLETAANFIFERLFIDFVTLSMVV
ncbi:MAG: hypothetical protein ACREV4_12950 [Gammaproteobacteria bacterium]